MTRTDDVRDLQRYYPLFNEGYGTEYERYALNKFASRMVDRYNISSVLELPANGVMGAPGIKSLIFAKVGCDVTVAHPSEEFLSTAKKVWDAFGLDATFVKSHWLNSTFDDNSFDLVWNFCVYEHFDDPGAVIREMLRVTQQYVFIEIQNVFNIGYPLHRIHHLLRREPWDHGNPRQMKLSDVERVVTGHGASVVETGATDMPPWPDINIKLREMVSKKKSVQIRKIDKNPADELRPTVVLRDVSDVVGDMRSFGKSTVNDDVVLRMFDLWHFLVETKSPSVFKKFVAHHPYVIAEKI